MKESESIQSKLKELRALKISIDEMNDELRQLNNEFLDSSGMCKQYDSNYNTLKDKVAAYRYRKLCLYLQCYDAIETLETETDKRLLKLRYLYGYTWDTVAEKMGYSIRQTYNLHNRALEKLKE